LLRTQGHDGSKGVVGGSELFRSPWNLCENTKFPSTNEDGHDAHCAASAYLQSGVILISGGENLNVAGDEHGATARLDLNNGQDWKWTLEGNLQINRMCHNLIALSDTTVSDAVSEIMPKGSKSKGIGSWWRKLCVWTSWLHSRSGNL